MLLISLPRIFKDQGSGYLLRVSKGTLKWTGPVKLLSSGQLGTNLKSILVLTLVHNRSSWESKLDPSPLLLFIETYIQGKTFYTTLLLSPSRIQLEWHSKTPARPRPPCPGCLLSSSWSPPAVQPSPGSRTIVFLAARPEIQWYGQWSPSHGPMPLCSITPNSLMDQNGPNFGWGDGLKLCDSENVPFKWKTSSTLASMSHIRSSFISGRSSFIAGRSSLLGGGLGFVDSCCSTTDHSVPVLSI